MPAWHLSDGIYRNMKEYEKKIFFEKKRNSLDRTPITISGEHWDTGLLGLLG